MTEVLWLPYHGKFEVGNYVHATGVIFLLVFNNVFVFIELTINLGNVKNFQ